MDGFAAVRALARVKHAQMLECTGGEACATALLLAARSAEKMKVQVISKSHPLLGGADGALRRGTRMIAVCAEASPELQAFYEAHEFGHLWIETVADPVHVSTGMDPGIPEEPSPLGIHRVEAYSAQELRERYANVFAREFLLPTDIARRLFVDEGKNASTIAAELGLPIPLVHQQLAVALLLPIPAERQRGHESPSPGLDLFQRAAAELRGHPALVEAGPGTGKTRTLIARIEYLLAQGVMPSSLLALTFSNKAAQEIKDRVAKAAPTAAAEIWAGTFHAFGLEIVRKYADLVGIQEPVCLIDQANALALLEQELPSLGLDHYLRLYEPLQELRHILKAISRAKDEVFSPTEYEAAAQRMAQAAQTEEDALKAAKALEVSRVYTRYEDVLRQNGIVDFSDLINRPIEILQAYPGVLADYQAQFQHVLVDEYQDVNRASAILLKLLAGEARHLWVVGDARQSIYRFRGAAPSNTQKFETDFPEAQRVPLGVNYRSHEQIVRVCDTFSQTMSATGGHGGTTLQAHRGLGTDSIAFNLAADLDAEISGIAMVIEAKRKQGYAYRNQAVLCRAHGSLEEVAAGLERAGVPVLYLGDLFERPEVRDLLAILSFTSEPDRGGLYRIATMPEYMIPLEDVRAFLAFAAAQDLTPLAALTHLDEAHDISVASRTALAHVRTDIGEVQFKTGPATLLCRLLFDRSALLRRLLADDDASAQQRRLALHQFLQFAIENDFASDGDPKKKLLDWIRRLEVFGDERALRELPAAVEGIDAVRLMTVHASKGLEFPIVHLPILGKGRFPLSYRGNRCPPPDGMLSTSEAASHEEEEECLFFVALSRAEEHLSLSRALRYSERQQSNPSSALERIQGHLDRSITSVPTWTGRTEQQVADGVLPSLAVRTGTHDGRDIELYLDCPRRYLYQVVLGLSGSREDNGYVRFHRAVYRVLHWGSAQSTGTTVTAVDLRRELEQHWVTIGPHDHPFTDLYKAAAHRILDQVAPHLQPDLQAGVDFEVQIGEHIIRVPIDQVNRQGARPIVRRFRTGRAPQQPDTRVLHALMAEAGRQAFGADATFEIHYLTSDESVPISFKNVRDRRLTDCRQAIAGIEAGRFPPRPNDERCPRCLHYFICPTLPD